jgi:hypothetical protein
MPVRTGKKTYNRGTGVVLGMNVELEVHECGECGVVFGMGVGFANARREDHEGWYCPNGHRWSFRGESELERAQRLLNIERDRSARERALRDQTEASLRATKGVVTKQKKKLGRVAAGVCPCCTRSFNDLARHMAAKHPDFTKEQTEAATSP